MEFEKLQQIISEVLNVDAEEITMDTTFVDDLGADSLDIFQIIMGIEEEFDIEISNEDAEKIVSVGDAVEEIKNPLNENRGNRCLKTVPMRGVLRHFLYRLQWIKVKGRLCLQSTEQSGNLYNDKENIECLMQRDAKR